MAKFIAQVRAIKHLTADVEIEAESLEDARAKLKLDGIQWDESEPEDQQIEAINPA